MGQKILTCNLCELTEFEVLLIEDGINVVKCKNCGFAYSQTLPEKVFERKEKAEDIFTETEKQKKRVYIQVLERIKAKKSGSLIDIGCRTGNFMLLCKREDFQPVVGVEISEKFAKFAHALGFKVFNCSLEETTLPDQSFDIITYLETLEHINTPVQELTEAHRILKNNGIIVVEVPNLTFQLFKVKVSRFFHIGHFGLKSHDHVVHFTEKTIRAALAKAGFKNIRTTPRERYIGAELPIYFKALSVLHNRFSRLVSGVSGFHIGSAIIATAQKNTRVNDAGFKL